MNLKFSVRASAYGLAGLKSVGFRNVIQDFHSTDARFDQALERIERRPTEVPSLVLSACTQGHGCTNRIADVEERFFNVTAEGLGCCGHICAVELALDSSPNIRSSANRRPAF